jgi:hypothetical protein
MTPSAGLPNAVNIMILHCFILPAVTLLIGVDVWLRNAGLIAPAQTG